MRRALLITRFLASHGWEDAEHTLIAGDASFRHYERLRHNGKSAILMDAPPDKENIQPFITIDGYLRQHNLNAPEIMAADITQGLLLLEDLGDDLIKNVLEKASEKEEELYQAIADVLITLYRNASSYNIPIFSKDKMLAQVSLLTDWFMPLISNKETDKKLAAQYYAIWSRTIARLPALKPVMVLYDYHAENLLWLPERAGLHRIGLLDFQDAMLGSPAYDMVSFLEDARRDVSHETVAKTIAYYLERTQIPEEDFKAAYAIMGAQRNCRIIGTFARLKLRDHKPRYLAFMHRVWQHIETDVSHPSLNELKNWLDVNIPQAWRL